MEQEAARKYVYVPEDAFARMTEQSRPITSHMTSMDSEMLSILDDNTIKSPYEKWLKYSQTLNRYMQYKNLTRKPISLDIVSNDATAIDETTANFDHIISSIPINFQTKAKLLVAKLVSEPGFTIHPNGEVSIENEHIAGSNIVDLISDVVRKRKNFTPVGWQKFSTYLSKVNVPRDWIGNVERYLTTSPPTNLRVIETSPSFLSKKKKLSSPSFSSTPIARRRRGSGGSAIRTQTGVSRHFPPGKNWQAYESDEYE